MNLIQSVMLVLLGFFVASLLAIVVAPAFWARAVRLTTKRIRETLPLTEAEIRADKDRIRAQYAIKVHQLEQQVEGSKLRAARQLIELNRRDAAISQLQTRVGDLQATLDEHQNARRVLEQTITERLPKVEARLAEARKLLFARDKDIAELSQNTARQSAALAEATGINTQQRGEIERLRKDMQAQQALAAKFGKDARSDGEVAMRAEIDALRARTREQNSLIQRLHAGAGRDAAALRAKAAAMAAAATGSDAAGEAVRRELASAEGAIKHARGVAEGGGPLSREVAEEIKRFKARTDEQAAEIARLKAELAGIEEGAKQDRRGLLRDTKFGLKAKLGGITAKSDKQAETIQRLRAELAAANERAAKQAQYFVEELRRLGAGTRPHAEPRTRGSAGANGAHAGGEPRSRRGIVERLGRSRSAASPSSGDASAAAPAAATEAATGTPAGPTALGAAGAPVTISSTARPPLSAIDSRRVSGFLRALGDEKEMTERAAGAGPGCSEAASPATEPATPTASEPAREAAAQAAEPASEGDPGEGRPAQEPAAAAADTPAVDPSDETTAATRSAPTTTGRRRLLDRLSLMSKG